MRLALTKNGEKYINHICGTCNHLRLKIATEEHLDPLVPICGLTNEETTEGATFPNWEIERE